MPADNFIPIITHEIHPRFSSDSKQASEEKPLELQSGRHRKFSVALIWKNESRDFYSDIVRFHESCPHNSSNDDEEPTEASYTLEQCFAEFTKEEVNQTIGWHANSLVLWASVACDVP